MGTHIWSNPENREALNFPPIQPIKNKNTLKYSGLANSNAVSIQAGANNSGIVLKLGKTSSTWSAKRGRRVTVVKATNLVGKINPALKAVARKRVCAILRSQKA